MANALWHLQGGYTGREGLAGMKNGRASNIASTHTGQMIEASPIPIGISLKRKRRGANLNERFDRMMDSVNMVSRSSTHPVPASKRRKRESTSGSSSDPPAPETPRSTSVGRNFSMIKLQDNSASSMLSDSGSELTIAANMPSWLTHTLCGLQPQHPLRRLVPGLEKASSSTPKSALIAPSDETPFAFHPPPAAPEAISPIIPGGDHVYAPSNLTPDFNSREGSVVDGLYAAQDTQTAFYVHPEDSPSAPALRLTDQHPQPQAHLEHTRDPEYSPATRTNSPNVSLVDSELDGIIEEPDSTFAHGSTSNHAERPFRFRSPTHMSPADGPFQQDSQEGDTYAAARNIAPSPSGGWSLPPVTPVVERGGTLSLASEPPILLEDDEDVFAFSSSPRNHVPPVALHEESSSLPLPPSSHRFVTPVPPLRQSLDPPPPAPRYSRRDSSLSIVSFVSPSVERRTRSPPPVDLSQLDFRWTPGPIFRPQRAPLTSPPAPIFAETFRPHEEGKLETLAAPTHEQPNSSGLSSPPSSDDLDAHVRRLQRMLQSSSEAGSPARNTSSAAPSATNPEEPAQTGGDEWEVVTPRRYTAGPTVAPSSGQPRTPQERHDVAPRVATPEPPTPAFAPAPGIYISPLRTPTDADDDAYEDVSQADKEVEATGGDEVHVEPVEEYDYEPSQRRGSRGSEHDSIESWTA
ncbi:unnamed protein product [Peniophora sp. CBMAI 1063]|nr:unnamed protein product [Peniophora sp. CBMAI 1063]